MSDAPRVQLRRALDGDVMTFDTARNTWSPRTPATSAAAPPTVTLNNGEASAIAKCRAVVVWSADTAKLASKASTGLARVGGLVLVGAGATLPMTVQTSDKFAATAAEWDAVTGDTGTGDTGGLIAGSRYFLGTAGGLTTTPTTTAGDSLCLVGEALNTTDMNLRIGEPILR